MHQIGVCSWSLRPATPEELAAQTRACGVDAVQLALDPIRTGWWSEAETVAALDRAGVSVVSGMMAMAGEDYRTLESIRRTGGVRLDEHWAANLAAAEANAAFAERLGDRGLRLVTFHAGFLPHESGNPLRAVMIERVRKIATIFGRRGVGVALETGQETAETLIGVLGEVSDAGVGVNFDPANLILYGMGEPVAALRRLAPWVRQVHIKDATPADRPDVWGTERPAGEGAVDWPAFFGVLREACPGVGLMIEREGGNSRLGEIRGARELIGALAAGR